jgi:predicted alpha/beta-fold hydrolase
MSLAGVKLADFRPKLPWWGGDLQTIRNYAISVNLALPGKAAQRIEVPLEDGSGDRLIGALHVPGRGGGKRPLVALVHGIAGCERSCYMIAAGAYFLARGYPVLRVNLRGAGPSRPYCRRQYHAGNSEDFEALLDKLDPTLTRHGVLAVGFSLGGNLLLKYLGETGSHGPVLRAATVSAPLDLRLASRALMRWRNFPYHRYIITSLKRNCTAPGALLSEAERRTVLGATSLWQLDDAFTAPRHGYAGAEDYYGANSSREFLGGLRKPTLMIHAKDDPFVPVRPYLESRWQDHPWLSLMLPRSGGHLGFHEPSGVWYLRQIEEFFSQR